MRKYGVLVMIAAAVLLSCIWYADASKINAGENGVDQIAQAVEVETDGSVAQESRKTETVAGISFEVPEEWEQLNKSDDRFDDVYYYPETLGQEYSHYIDLFYVSLENLSRSDAALTIMEYYGGFSEKMGENVSESCIQEISGERALRFSVHYEDKEKIEYMTMIPIHGKGLMVVTYAVKDKYDAIYLDDSNFALA